MKVIKQGVLDTIQDGGRYDYAQLGIAPGGCMDQVAGKLANSLVGNTPEKPVLEMHFPAPVLQFGGPCTIALCGADFGAKANGISIPLNRRVFLPGGSTLKFEGKTRGQRCYLGLAGGWHLEPVMGSYSTHLRAGFGGWKGRGLQKGDILPYTYSTVSNLWEPEIAGWFIYTGSFYREGPVRVVAGPEWDWLSYHGKKQMLNELFTIGLQSDRMGYHLHGPAIERLNKGELLSSGVLPGTIQLLPNGEPLLLMADCQTTGGYPRVLQVAAVDLPRLAQMGAGESFNFDIISMQEAGDLLHTLNARMKSLEGAANMV